MDLRLLLALTHDLLSPTIRLHSLHCRTRGNCPSPSCSTLIPHLSSPISTASHVPPDVNDLDICSICCARQVDDNTRLTEGKQSAVKLREKWCFNRLPGHNLVLLGHYNKGTICEILNKLISLRSMR